MKEGWEIKKLGEIAYVEYGFTDKSTDEGNYRYVRITDIDNNGELISTEKKYLKHSKEAETFLLQHNDILMARTGATFAKVLLYEDLEPSVFASYLIRIKFKEKIENKLYWYFSKTKSYWDQANSLSSGAAQPHFNGAALKQVIFSYPKSISEQQRIVSILDETFAAIAKAKVNAEQNLRNAKELFESYLQGVFEKKGYGWEEKTLGEVCHVIGGGTPSKANNKFYNGNICWATVRDMKGEIITNTEHKITDDAVKNSSTNIIPKGNVIIATRVGLGKICLIQNDTAINQDLRGVVPKNPNKLSVDFLFRWFKSIAYKIVEEGTGATVQGVKLPFVKSLPISLPSIKEQKTIVQKLDALSAETKKLEAIYQQKINDLEELKKSILQKAFSGELSSREVGLKTEKLIEI